MQAEPQYMSVESRVRLLRSMPDLAAVSVDALVLLAERSRFRRFRKRASIWREQESVESVLYILEGRVRVELGGQVLGVVESRGALGFTALLTDSGHLTATAEVATVALEIPGDAVRAALGRDFGLQRIVLRGLARALLAQRGPVPEVVEAPERGPSRRVEMSLVERVIALRASPILRANVDALAELASAAVEVRAEEGEILWREGEPATFWLRLESGLIACETEEGDRAVVGAGTDLGYLEVLADEPRRQTARAASRAVGLRIELIDWFNVLELHTRFALDLTAILAREHASLAGAAQAQANG